MGADGKMKSKKEMEGLNKVNLVIPHLKVWTAVWLTAQILQVLKEIQAKKEAEMVQKIIEKVKAECKAQGEDVDRRGYTKHYANNT